MSVVLRGPCVRSVVIAWSKSGLGPVDEARRCMLIRIGILCTSYCMLEFRFFLSMLDCRWAVLPIDIGFIVLIPAWPCWSVIFVDLRVACTALGVGPVSERSDSHVVALLPSGFPLTVRSVP